MKLEPNRRLPVFAFAFLTLACQGTESDPSAFEDEAWTVSPEPVVVIGGADEREGYLLERVNLNEVVRLPPILPGDKQASSHAPPPF